MACADLCYRRAVVRGNIGHRNARLLWRTSSKVDSGFLYKLFHGGHFWSARGCIVQRRGRDCSEAEIRIHPTPCPLWLSCGMGSLRRSHYSNCRHLHTRIDRLTLGEMYRAIRIVTALPERLVGGGCKVTSDHLAWKDLSERRYCTSKRVEKVHPDCTAIPVQGDAEPVAISVIQ